MHEPTSDTISYTLGYNTLFSFNVVQVYAVVKPFSPLTEPVSHVHGRSLRRDVLAVREVRQQERAHALRADGAARLKLGREDRSQTDEGYNKTLQMYVHICGVNPGHAADHKRNATTAVVGISMTN